MNDNTYFKTDDVREAATGRWPLILGALAPQLETAMRKLGRHVSCPVHGGKDGFRLFKKDFAEHGGGICNTCGPKKDGFELLMWLNHWDFRMAVEEVGKTLGVEPRHRRPTGNASGPSRGTSFKQQHADRSNSPAPAIARPTSSAPSAAGALQASSAPRTASAESREPEVSSPPASKVVSLEERSPEWLRDLQERMSKQSQVDNAKIQERIERVWYEAVPITSPSALPAMKYLASRKIVLRNLGVLLEGDCVRFHPGLPYFEEVEETITQEGNETTITKWKKKGDYPAIICAIRNVDGEIVTLHRTYLSQSGGKARVESARKMMSVPDNKSVVGGAIRMGSPVDGVLGVAEGLETALSGFRATGIPTWSLVNTTLLEGFEPPQDVHTVIIWADKDKSHAGERSANVLKSRLEGQGLNVVVLIPQQPIPARAKGVDWNDVMRTQGLLGFPNPRLLRQQVNPQAQVNS